MRHEVHRVIYDDGCAFCVRQMRRLQRWDWLGRFRLVPRSSPEAREPGLPPEALERALHCVTADGRVLRGARALRFVGLRLPLTAPLAALLWLPGALALAERAYAWVSRHRHTLGGGARAPENCGAGCAPGRDRPV
jgi:predicted DCC family thiol-disulfide oxidoreductase YuxK